MRQRYHHCNIVVVEVEVKRIAMANSIVLMYMAAPSEHLIVLTVSNV